MNILICSPKVVNQANLANDFIAMFAELEAEETFEAAYAAAVGCYNNLVEMTGDADWSFVWEQYQRAFGVAAGFYAPAPMSDEETRIPDDDVIAWQMATRSSINPF